MTTGDERYTITMGRTIDQQWYAVFEDDFSHPGYGDTRYEALQSLCEQLEDVFDADESEDE